MEISFCKTTLDYVQCFIAELGNNSWVNVIPNMVMNLNHTQTLCLNIDNRLIKRS